MPRVYAASPEEMAERMKASAGGRSDTILYEEHVWGPGAAGFGTTDRLPEKRTLSSGRLQAMFENHGKQTISAATVASRSPVSARSRLADYRQDLPDGSRTGFETVLSEAACRTAAVCQIRAPEKLRCHMTDYGLCWSGLDAQRRFVRYEH